MSNIFEHEAYVIQCFYIEHNSWTNYGKPFELLADAKNAFRELSNNGTLPGYRIKHEKYKSSVVFESGPSFKHYEFY